MLNYGEENAVLLNCVPIFPINTWKKKPKQLSCLSYILADLAVTRLNGLWWKSGDYCLKNAISYEIDVIITKN